MAGMGSTGTVNITPEMMDNAVKAIGEYRTVVEGLHTNIESEVTTLTAHDFTGSAANGYVTFYQNNINPATGKGITDMLSALEQICLSVKAAIPDVEGVDEQLGSANSK